MLIANSNAGTTSTTTRRRRPQQAGEGLQRVDLVGDVLQHVVRDDGRVVGGLVDRHGQLAHAHPRVVLEPLVQPREAGWVGFAGGELDAHVGPVGGVVAHPGADLQQVVAEIRHPQRAEPAPVVHRGAEVLKDVRLQLGVANYLVAHQSVCSRRSR
nr:hypothetical protein [Fodinicola feengrottensis]